MRALVALLALAVFGFGCNTITTPTGMVVSTPGWTSIVMNETPNSVSVGITTAAADDNMQFNWGDVSLSKSAGEGKKISGWEAMLGLAIGVLL